MTTCSRPGCAKTLRSNNTTGMCGSGCLSPEAPPAKRAKGLTPSKGGEQGPNALEVELAGLRAEVSRSRQDQLRLTLQRDAAEKLVGEQRELILTLKAERDLLVAELALLRVPGGSA